MQRRTAVTFLRKHAETKKKSQPSLPIGCHVIPTHTHDGKEHEYNRGMGKWVAGVSVSPRRRLIFFLDWHITSERRTAVFAT